MSQAEAAIWLLIALSAVGNFALRYSFIMLMGRFEVPRWVRQALPFIPATALASLLAPALLAVPVGAANGNRDVVWQLAAWLTTLGLAWRGWGAILAIGGGMAMLWLGLWVVGTGWPVAG